MADPYELEKSSADPVAQPPPAEVATDSSPPLAPMPTEIPQMRFCPACGYNLTGLTDDHCPRCFRPFDPFDPSTTTDKPPRKLHERNYWLEAPRIAGYAALLLTLLGRILINLAAPDWAARTAPRVAEDIPPEVALLDRGGQAAGVVLASLSALLLIPWIAGVTFLSLTALDDRLGGRLMTILGAALVIGCILVLGYDPTLFILAAVVALLTGLVYRFFSA
ncbi:MAG: hypothetical protein AAF797_15460 [Planctomycetota bacterium]